MLVVMIRTCEELGCFVYILVLDMKIAVSSCSSQTHHLETMTVRYLAQDSSYRNKYKRRMMQVVWDAIY